MVLAHGAPQLAVAEDVVALEIDLADRDLAALADLEDDARGAGIQRFVEDLDRREAQAALVENTLDQGLDGVDLGVVENRVLGDGQSLFLDLVGDRRTRHLTVTAEVDLGNDGEFPHDEDQDLAGFTVQHGRADVVELAGFPEVFDVLGDANRVEGFADFADHAITNRIFWKTPVALDANFFDEFLGKRDRSSR